MPQQRQVRHLRLLWNHYHRYRTMVRMPLRLRIWPSRTVPQIVPVVIPTLVLIIQKMLYYKIWIYRYPLAHVVCWLVPMVVGNRYVSRFELFIAVVSEWTGRWFFFPVNVLLLSLFLIIGVSWNIHISSHFCPFSNDTWRLVSMYVDTITNIGGSAFNEECTGSCHNQRKWWHTDTNYDSE